jgi:hypothetical protein
MKFIWVHEICGNAPVHPLTWVCMNCKTPVFSAECRQFKVSEKWIKDHPSASAYIVEEIEK